MARAVVVRIVWLIFCGSSFGCSVNTIVSPTAIRGMDIAIHISVDPVCFFLLPMNHTVYLDFSVSSSISGELTTGTALVVDAESGPQSSPCAFAFPSTGTHTLRVSGGFRYDPNRDESDPPPNISPSPPAPVRVVEGWLSILPPLLATVIAFWSRQVYFALLVGLWVACLVRFGAEDPLMATTHVFDGYFIGAIANAGHAMILVLTFLLGGMVGVITKAGGATGLSSYLVRYATSSKHAMVIVWSMALLLFIDDYMNVMITGATLLSVADRLHVSREKIAFLVDSAAAAGASLSPVSSWVGFEVGLIADSIAPDSQLDPYVLFLRSIPYRLYPVFLLILTLFVCLSRYDMAPLFHAENAARLPDYIPGEDCLPKLKPRKPLPTDALLLPKDPVDPDEVDELYSLRRAVVIGAATDMPPAMSMTRCVDYIRPWKPSRYNTGPSQASPLAAVVSRKQGIPYRWPNALLPTAVTIIVAVLGMVLDGKAVLNARQDAGEPVTGHSLTDILGYADAIRALVWGAMAGCLISCLLAGIQRILTMEEATSAFIAGISAILPADLILLLAWAFSDALTEIHTAAVVVQAVDSWLPPGIVPFVVIILCALTSFATGSSWGTMGIMFPLCVPLIQKLAPGDDELLVMTISTVLAGSVFGDHCSPIADTTILSSVSCQCLHMNHVRTQIPYALLVGIGSSVLGILPVGMRWVPLWVAYIVVVPLLLGAVVLFGARTPSYIEDRGLVGVLERSPTPTLSLAEEHVGVFIPGWKRLLTRWEMNYSRRRYYDLDD